MGEVVEFKGFQSKLPSCEQAVPAGGAQILFFLGVRYERQETPAAPAHLKKRTRGRAADAKPASKPAAKRRKSRQRA
jgi:hypothetical protein